jgi:hypothetical protein
MRLFTMFAVAVVAFALGFGVKAVFAPGSSATPESINGTEATSNTLSPHEIHVNYRTMRELPVHEVKDPF